MSRHLWPHTVAETDSTVFVQQSYFLKSLRKINQNPQVLHYPKCHFQQRQKMMLEEKV